MNFVAHVQYAATATLLGLTFLAPSASSADPAPVAAHHEQQGLRWPVQATEVCVFPTNTHRWAWMISTHIPNSIRNAAASVRRPTRAPRRARCRAPSRAAERA